MNPRSPVAAAHRSRRVPFRGVRIEVSCLPVPIAGWVIFFLITNAAIILLGRLSGKLSRRESVIYVGLMLIGLLEFAILVLCVRMRQ